MNEHEFKRLMSMAKLIPGDYSAGYQRGLRRHYHGDKFGTDAEHNLWLKMGIDGDHRTELGKGYRDGLAGREPAPKGRPATMQDGKRVNVYLDQPSLDRAADLGDGNVSAGIRKALS